MTTKVLTDEMIDDDFPQEVKDILRPLPRVPEFDSTLGVTVSTKKPQKTPPHRLVTIGDSLTQGYQSGAISNTDLSYPMTIAWEMGWDRQFRRPNSFSTFGGLQLNIEYYLRQMESRFGEKLDWWETAPAIFAIRELMDQNEDYWERGAGADLYNPPRQKEINHNLAIYGWDIRDLLSLNTTKCRQRIGEPKDNLLKQVVENANERVALRVLSTAKDPQGAWSMIDAATALGTDGTPETDQNGIETLVVMIGANNILSSVSSLKIKWSDNQFQDLEGKESATAWLPSHFALEFDELVNRVQKIKAQNVILCTVPHVTIPPITRGIGTKVRPDSRYFPYYSRPWIADDKFNRNEDEHLTGNQARALDSVVDSYNDHIVKRVRENRQAGRNWYLFDLCTLLDRVAARRYIHTPAAQPTWWTPYEFPAALQALTPPPDSQFFRSGLNPTTKKTQRTTGGIFSLDGIHPTTIAYGIIAQEIINIMQQAGVKFYYGNSPSDQLRERVGPVRVDFQRLIKLDTLVADPPMSLTNDLNLIGWLDEQLDIIRRIF
jgi:hypothetical protein